MVAITARTSTMVTAMSKTRAMTRPSMRHLLRTNDYSGNFISLAYLIFAVIFRGRYHYISILYKAWGKYVLTNSASQAPGPGVFPWLTENSLPSPRTSVPSPVNAKWQSWPCDFWCLFQVAHAVIYWLNVSNQSLSFDRGRKTLYTNNNNFASNYKIQTFGHAEVSG